MFEDLEAAIEEARKVRAVIFEVFLYIFIFVLFFLILALIIFFLFYLITNQWYITFVSLETLKKDCSLPTEILVIYYMSL